MDWRCDNGHYWNVIADEFVAELWRVEGDLGSFTYAGVDTSICPVCMAHMGMGWDISYAMPRVPVPMVGVSIR